MDVCRLQASIDENMLIAEAFLKTLVKVYGKDTVYSDGGTWYPQAYNFLGLVHRLHSPFEKSIIERTIQYFKGSTEVFDDYYPCLKGNSCTLLRVHNWIRLFISIYNSIISIKPGSYILCGIQG
jgi:putative transposase